ncbi:MAG: GDSL-type esterase/lipase family protein, partial [Planctomycetota bacterium]
EHVPGCVSAAVLSEESLATDVIVVGQTERDLVRLGERKIMAMVESLAKTSVTRAPSKLIVSEGDKIVAIGDSITAAGGYLRMMDRVLAERYPDLKLPKIINKGIGGQKAEDLIRRFDRDVVQNKPAVVTICIGINDVWHRLRGPHNESVLAAYKSNVSKMVAAAQKAGIRAILLTPTVIQEDITSEGNRRLKMYVAAMKEVSVEKGCQIVDLHGAFISALKTRAEVKSRGWLTGDGVHMNPLGDSLMAALTLRGLGASPQSSAANDGVAYGSSRLVEKLKAGKAQKIVTYGTSLTSGGAWVKQFDGELQARFPGLVTVTNSGRGGMWSRWGVENLVSRVIAKKPDTLLIEFGINDAYHPYKTTVTQARANLGNMIDRVLDAKADTEIVLMTMNPPIDNHLKVRGDIKRYYEMYRDVAKERGLKIVDHEPNWARVIEHNRNSFRDIVPDGIHPAADGCEILTTPTLLNAFGVPPVGAKDKIKVLLMGGRGSHDWTRFYTVLKPLLEKTGDFELYVALELENLLREKIQQYDLVLFYGPGGDFTDVAQEQGLHEFVKGGGGLAGVHATDAFKKSDVYWRLFGGRFITHRGGRFTIRIMDEKHPVTEGIGDCSGQLRAGRVVGAHEQHGAV